MSVCVMLLVLSTFRDKVNVLLVCYGFNIQGNILQLQSQYILRPNSVTNLETCKNQSLPYWTVYK